MAITGKIYPIILFSYLPKSKVRHITETRRAYVLSPTSIASNLGKVLDISESRAYTEMLRIKGFPYVSGLLGSRVEAWRWHFPVIVYDINYRWELDVLRRNIGIHDYRVPQYPSLLTWTNSVDDCDVFDLLDNLGVEKKEE